MSLTRLTRTGVGQIVEFVPTPDPDFLAEILVAFANADGGTIVAGAFANGTLNHGLMVEDIESALFSAQSRCRPPVRVEWQASETDSGLPILLIVPRSTDLHSMDDGRVLIRSGRVNRPLGGEEIRQLASGKGSGEFETESVAGATRDDLDPQVIVEYLQKRKERMPHAIADTEDRILREIGALTPDGTPTVAGLLLFGRKPQAFIPKSGLLFVRFLGQAGQHGSATPSAQYGRREEINGALPLVIRDAWNILWQELNPKDTVNNGLAREQSADYPPGAVREALVNAVAHRDYRLTGRQIEIRMYDDKLEIISPGGLPGYITIDNIVDEHFSRNPRTVGGLFCWGYIEELGTGIDRMIDEMARAGHPNPDFKATPFSFTVTLYNRQERTPMFEWEDDMNERQLKALNYVQQYDRITNREYRELCPHVSGETVRLDLADLVSRGVLLKIGDKRGTYYILKSKPRV
jgi:ATP-dependent DNA helicase RecG